MRLFIYLAFILCTLKVTFASAVTNCNDGRFYIREDPTSCSHFYKCDNGNPVRFPCPGNLYFNPSTYNCDWPYNVKCDVNQGSSQQNGYPNNNGGQYNGNNVYPNNNGGQNNGNPNNNGGQYNSNNEYPNNNGGQYNGNNEYPNNNGGQYNGNNGYPNNNGGSNNGNNGYPNNNGGQNNGNPNNNGGHNSGNNGNGQGQRFNNQDDDEFFYPVQPVDAQDPGIGPSIIGPEGGFDEDRPRPVIDDLYSSRNNPYQDYLRQNDVRYK